MNAERVKPEQIEKVKAWRLRAVFVVFACLFFALVFRLFFLHTIDQPFLFEQGEKRTVRVESQPALRGSITDRYGRPLAVSTPVVNLWVNPQQLDLAQIPVIAKALGEDRQSLHQRLAAAQSQGRSYMYLKRQVRPHDAEALLKLRISGISGELSYRRYYPAAEVAAHVLGVVDIDGKGQEGLELAYDEYLQGTSGKRQVVKDLYGNVIKQLQVKSVSTPGEDLVLTLDLRLQYIAYRELKAVVTEHQATSGSAVLLDAKKGEILALVSQPSFNPNNRAQLKPEQMRNRAIADLIEPGSTIKPFVVAAALTGGDYQPNTVINTAPGVMRVKGKTIRDYRNLGELDITSIITKSSNVGVAKLAMDMGAERVWQFYTQAGIGQTSSALGFPGEAVGQMPYPEQLDDLRLATVAYGYGLAMSPLGLAHSYTSFTQQGCMQPLSLIQAKTSISSCQQVMPPHVAKQVLSMLETVVSDVGTGRRARVANYSAGGKTGTAHRIGQAGYDKNSYTAAFAGVAPANDPDLVLVVVVDDPKGREYYGGEVAAPVFARIMEQALRLRQVIPDSAEMLPMRMAGG